MGGSVAPSYELPDDGTYTFYYLELALEAKLQKKVNQLKEVMGKSKGEIKYDNKNTETIADGKEAMRWREQFTGRRKRSNKDGDHKKEVFHAFRAAPEGGLKEEALKKEGKANVTQKQVVERTWYSQEAWEHGGLRIKNEVKSEESPPRNSRRRSNLNCFDIEVNHWNNCLVEAKCKRCFMAFSSCFRYSMSHLLICMFLKF